MALATFSVFVITFIISIWSRQIVKRKLQPIIPRLIDKEALNIDINKIVWDLRVPDEVRNYNIASNILAIVAMIFGSLYAIFYGPWIIGVLGMIGSFIAIFRLVRNWLVFIGHKKSSDAALS